MRVSTDQAVDDMVEATMSNNATPQQRHLFRESLRALVRMAKAEQLQDIKASVAKLVGSDLATQKKKHRTAAPPDEAHRQRQLEFNQKMTHPVGPACSRQDGK